MAEPRRTTSRRAALAAGAILAALALTGCDATGDVVVGAETVSLDVRVSHGIAEFVDGVSPCYGSARTSLLVVSDVVSAGGRVDCRLTAELPRDELGNVPDVTVRTAGGHVFLTLPSYAFQAIEPDSTLDLTTTFADAEVVAASGGEVVGDRVRWRSLLDLQDGGMGVTLRVAPGVPGWLVPGALGLGLGFALVAAVRGLALALVGRRDEPPDPVHGYPRRRQGLPFRRPAPTTGAHGADGSSLAPAPRARPTAPRDPDDSGQWAPGP